ALATEAEHLIECIRTGSRPMADGHAGLRVVRILEAAQASIDTGSNFVTVRSRRGLPAPNLSARRPSGVA
ncbi:MAG TPA: hypothetical protein VHM24_05875, partial [Gemmatimonadaceae bacterium]|nr:hypothetical protein [Gemmatimonadaceae bacterium]